MQLTASTLPLGLLLLYLCYRSKGQLLPVAMFASIFQAASVFNIGKFIGVQPVFLVLLLELFKKFAGRPSPKLPQPFPPRWTLLTLLALVVYSIASALVNPFVFEGTPVTGSRFGIGAPLVWEAGHLNQVFYLVLAFALYVSVAYKTSPGEIRKSIDWYIGGCVLAALIGVYQFVGMKTGLPFPREIFDTSPTYAMFHVYEIAEFTRVNSTFPEASAVAGTLTVGLAIVLWRIISGSLTRRNLATAAIILLGILLTLSSTGYVCLAFLFFVCLLKWGVHWKRNHNYRVRKTLLLVPLSATFFLMLAFSGPRNYIFDLVDTVLLTKKDSDSYRERAQWNETSLNTAAETYYLGVGFGVCRASSLIPTILANIGLPGLFLFALFVGHLYVPLLKSNSRIHPERRAVLLGLSAFLLNGVVAAPEMTAPILWVLMAAAAKAGGQYLPLAFHTAPPPTLGTPRLTAQTAN